MYSEHLVVRVDGAEQVALAHAAAGRAADVDLPLAAFDGDGAQVLHVGFGTVARAARRGELHLVRRLEALERRSIFCASAMESPTP